MRQTGAPRGGCEVDAVIDVVIPTLDEGDRIAATLESLFAGASDAQLDVVVVDGGSLDRTPALAREYGARVIDSAPGRSRQLQAGLEATAGDTVVFLHADTRLPLGWADALARALARPGVVAGAFDFGFEPVAGSAPGLACVERGARLRSRFLRLPYGDQALFARRRELERIGGVPQAVLMEDLDLVQRLRARGALARVALPVRTSPRRHLEHGIWRTAVRHAIAALGWRLGAPRARMRDWLAR